jgi:hypothetical protein
MGLAHLRLLDLLRPRRPAFNSIGLRAPGGTLGARCLGSPGWARHAWILSVLDTRLAFDARGLAFDAHLLAFDTLILLSLDAGSLLAFHARRLLAVSPLAAVAAAGLKHLHLLVTATAAAAAVTATAVWASICRRGNRQRGNACDEEYPGHEIISFRTA